MPTWDSNLYLKFANERTQPSIDLAGRVNLTNPNRIIDLGCGPGNSTAVVRNRWPSAEIVGLDSSPEMIVAAQKAYPDQTWLLGDIATWEADAPFDLVFSNAALHWVPDHARLFPHLLQQVKSGGALAVQMPAHYRSPLHRVIEAAAADPMWAGRLMNAHQTQTHQPPAFYYEALSPIASHLDIWETEYFHILEGPQGIVDWFRGTGLRPYLEALNTDAERQQFEAQVLAGYTVAYPRQSDGRVLFPFRRLFMVAYR